MPSIASAGGSRPPSEETIVPCGRSHPSGRASSASRSRLRMRKSSWLLHGPAVVARRLLHTVTERVSLVTLVEDSVLRSRMRRLSALLALDRDCPAKPAPGCVCARNRQWRASTDASTSLCQYCAVIITGTTITHSPPSAIAFLTHCRYSGAGW